MKWYRTFPCENTVSNPLICDLSNFSKYDNFGAGPYRVERAFYQGNPITNWPNDVYMTTENEDYDGIPDDCLQNAWMIPAYSERLVHAINNEEIEGFQFLPVTVYSYKRQQKFHYYIANCINIVSALNTGLSS